MNNQTLTVGLVGHSCDLDNVVNVFKYWNPSAPDFSEPLIRKMLEWSPPFKGTAFKDHIIENKNIGVNATHIIVPFIPDLNITMGTLLNKVESAIRLCAEEKCFIATLGAFTSIVCCGKEKAFKDKYGINITSGNTLTAALAVGQINNACEILDRELSECTVLIVGGSGDIGFGCAQVLCTKAKHTILAARSIGQLKTSASKIKSKFNVDVEVGTDISSFTRNADIILSTAASNETLIFNDDIKAGAIVCDVGFPKNVCSAAFSRNDILAFDGGLAELPTELNFGYDSKLPQKNILFGCYTEGLLLAAEKYNDLFSYGRGNITTENMEYIFKIAQKYKISPAPFYSGNRKIDTERICNIKKILKGK